jgi:hypothetical protein
VTKPAYIDVLASVAMNRNMVIVQFKVERRSDYDRFVAIEGSLIQAFSQCDDGVVDGHDVGQNRFNIFIYPRRSWGPVLNRVKAFLELRGALTDAVIVKFHGKSERYEVTYPTTYSDRFSI